MLVQECSSTQHLCFGNPRIIWLHTSFRCTRSRFSIFFLLCKFVCNWLIWKISIRKYVRYCTSCYKERHFLKINLKYALYYIGTSNWRTHLLQPMSNLSILLHRDISEDSQQTSTSNDQIGFIWSYKITITAVVHRTWRMIQSIHTKNHVSWQWIDFELNIGKGNKYHSLDVVGWRMQTDSSEYYMVWCLLQIINLFVHVEIPH